ncbi:MAG: DUF1003 domain-containing protein [Pseudomonadota bacterium]|nr:DUF1003 domain-containing protein [Pseudomonadota bacterium]
MSASPMPPDLVPDPALSASAQDNLEAMADLAEKEDATVSPLRAAIERVSSFFGTPGYFVFVTLFIASWVGFNLWGASKGWQHVDKAPFFWLQGIVSSNALLLTIAVLIRQDRMAQLAQHRAHLDLQINMLTERKVTKVLELVDAFRRERSLPSDEETGELIKPADPQAIMSAIKRSAESDEKDST